jgi:hypothetical protein
MERAAEEISAQRESIPEAPEGANKRGALTKYLGNCKYVQSFRVIYDDRSPFLECSFHNETGKELRGPFFMACVGERLAGQGRCDSELGHAALIWRVMRRWSWTVGVICTGQ